MKEQAKDLVLATELQPAVLFSDDHSSLDALLKKIEKEVSSIVPDITSAKGRKEITANVSRITKSKTTLEKAGKDYNAAQKELLKTFDSRRKHAFTFLEDLQKEVRKPLTEWEDKEKDRISKCEKVIECFLVAGNDAENWINTELKELKNLLKVVEETTITKRLAEFEDEAEIAKNEAIKKISNSIEQREKYDQDQIKMVEMQKSIDEQDRINYEADQRAKAERNAQEAVIEASKEAEAAKRIAAEIERQSVIDAEAAEDRRIKDVEAAAQKEVNRFEAEKQAEIEAEKKRAANKTHRGKINREIVAELIKCDITEEQAKKAVTLIAQNKIPNIKISY